MAFFRLSSTRNRFLSDDRVPSFHAYKLPACRLRLTVPRISSIIQNQKWKRNSTVSRLYYQNTLLLHNRFSEFVQMFERLDS